MINSTTHHAVKSTEPDRKGRTLLVKLVIVRLTTLQPKIPPTPRTDRNSTLTLLLLLLHLPRKSPILQSQSPKMAIPNLLLHFLLFPLVISALPAPDPETIQQLLPTHSPPSTIPAFPEQSNLQSCPLHLPPALFPGVKSACSSAASSAALHRTRCCPVLAAWLYSAYSATALSRPNRVDPAGNRTKYDMPLLPDDSENCVDSLEKGLVEKGIQLPKPNETCDAVYCYCGIQLHRFTCLALFSVNGGELVGDRRVRRLEKDCLSSNGLSSSGIGGFHGCSPPVSSSPCDEVRAVDDEQREGRRGKFG